MAQRLSYSVIPNTPDKSYLATINKILGHVSRTPLQFKDFREWLRDNQLWDRDLTPVALELMGVRVKPAVGLTELGVALLAAKDELDQKKVLFRAFRDRNTLLMKFVLEALDPESGGRLHSTYELHRMLTSYVYPGKHIPLTEFQAWIKWMTACDGVRLIGIRWGLGDVGKEYIEWFRARSADEILEDEVEEGELDAGDVPEGDVVAVAGAGAASPAMAPRATLPAAPPRQPAPPSPPARSVGSSAGEDEELPDMPPEAQPPEEREVERYLEQITFDPEPSPRPNPAAVAAAAARAVRSSGLVDAPSPLRPAVGLPRPAAFGLGSPRLVPRSIDPAALEETAQWVRAWWAGWPERSVVRLGALGVSAAAATRAPGLCEAAIAAIVCTSGAPDEVVLTWFRTLVDSGHLQAYCRNECSLDELLHRTSTLAGSDAAARLAELLVHASGLRQRLTAHPELAVAALDAQDGRVLAELLYHDVFGKRHELAVFWLIRELHMAGTWGHALLAEVAVVPSYPVRENAYRLGFVDSLYAGDFDALVDMSRDIGRYFGRDDEFDAPLAHLPHYLGCSFRCARVLACPLACREKLGA